MNEPELTKSTGVTNPLVLMQAMIERGTDPDALKKMMDLAERWERNVAAQKYANAIVEFQKRCPMIVKRRQADRYKFAPLDDIMREVGPILADCEIAISFSTPKQEAGWFTIVVHIRVGTHAEERPFTIPVADLQAIIQAAANSMKITTAQASGSWLQYQKRYALCAALGITVTGEDIDGQFDNETIGEQEQKTLENLLDVTRSDRERFLAWLDPTLKSIKEITKAQYPKALDVLVRKQKANVKKAGAA